MNVTRLLQHPHLSTLLGVVPLGDKIAVITPLVRGSNLHNIIFGDNRRKVCQYLCVHVGIKIM